jgi:hypothetical protein
MQAGGKQELFVFPALVKVLDSGDESRLRYAMVVLEK